VTAVTTDFRRVLSEVLVRRCGNPVLQTVFPDSTGCAPLGLVAGPDLTVDGVLANGFEAGSTGAWSVSVA
jgi:hypothetical protein